MGLLYFTLDVGINGITLLLLLLWGLLQVCAACPTPRLN